jgi:hypothetical protein
MTNHGWICPRCDRVWAPGMPSCQPCNQKVSVVSVSGTVPVDREAFLPLWSTQVAVGEPGTEVKVGEV